jgi:DNA modification methylase
MNKVKLMLGDNISSLKKLPDNSVDSIVSDPPYGLSFMGKKWDYDVPSVEFWKEVYRVLKPGGHVLSFGGTRTYHRMVVNIEDAGFEIRDQIMWLYGSGFPKSHNIGKAVDKFGGNNLLSSEIGKQLKEARTKRGLTLKAVDELFCGGTSNYNWLEGRSDGQRIPNQELFDKIVDEWPELKDIRDKVLETEREILGTEITNKTVMSKIGEENEAGEYVRTKGQSPYEGWGTALKPANEPICVARKPLSEKSVAENVLKWGTGGINIDGCRVGSEVRTTPIHSEDLKNDETMFGLHKTIQHERVETTEGRFPANIILECLCDEVIKGEKGEPRIGRVGTDCDNGIYEGAGWKKDIEGKWFNDKGDIHTNPMCPCRLLDEQTGYLKSGEVKPHHKKNKTANGYQGSCYGKFQNEDTTLKGYGDGGGASRFFYQAKVSKAERNMSGKCSHPTLKPIQLMSYLCKLVTPPGGIILDPFSGSGSTGISALLNDFRFIGMELEQEYFDIMQKRINDYESYRKFIKK